MALPTDPSTLPPLPAAFRATLDPLLVQLGERLSGLAHRAIEDQARLLLAWSPHVNLTALRSPEQVAREHVADSLSALPLLRELTGGRDVDLLDLGSGAGYPGLPLAVALPCRTAVLLESVGKKARFLTAVVAAVDATAAVEDRVAQASDGRGPTEAEDAAQWPRIEVRHARAEALLAAGRSGEARRWSVVTARAVASLERLVGLAMPLLADGGHLVAWKRDDGSGALEAEIAAARAVLDRIGGRVVRVEPVGLAGLEDHRLVVVVRRLGGGSGPGPRARSPLLP